MRVGIAPLKYLPSRGYFDLINAVDLFILDEDDADTADAAVDRTALKSAQGRASLVIPTRSPSGSQGAGQIEIDYEQHWNREHRRVISACLGAAPYVSDVLRLLDAELARQHRTVGQLNVALIGSVCDYLSIRTLLLTSSDLRVAGAGTERLIALLTTAGAATCVVGEADRARFDERRVREAGFELEYRAAQYAPYPQLWGPFDDAVSIIDLIASCGRHARHWMTNTRHRELAVA